VIVKDNKMAIKDMDELIPDEKTSIY